MIGVRFGQTEGACPIFARHCDRLAQQLVHGWMPDVTFARERGLQGGFGVEHLYFRANLNVAAVWAFATTRTRGGRGRGCRLWRAYASNNRERVVPRGLGMIGI